MGLWKKYNGKGFFAEIAEKDKLGNDISESLSDKVDKVEGYGLSQENFTSAYKDKLDTITSGAEPNVQSDWEEVDSGSDSYIKNKPEQISIQAGENISITESGSSLIISSQSAPQVNADWNSTSGASEILNKPDVINDVEYDSSTKKILFKAGETLVDEIDATDFIKDGMVNDVKIDNGNLVITFNTDAGKEDITIPLSEIFDPNNYYNKDAVDDLLGNKVDKVEGKQLSTEDYTTAEKTKLSGIDTGAQVNVQSDWEETDKTSDSFIRNKPQEISLSNGRGIEITEATDTLKIATTAVLPDDLATVATTGAYSDLNGAPAPISIVEGTGIDITESNNQIVISTDVDASTKADKVSGATVGNFAGLDANGNLVDSGSKAADFATAAQGALADTAVQDASYVHTDNNYTTAEKTKLTDIEDGAQVNVQSDWEETDKTSDAYIKHKPSSMSLIAGEHISIIESGGNLEISSSGVASTDDLAEVSAVIPSSASSTNLLVTHQEFDDALGDVETLLANL